MEKIISDDCDLMIEEIDTWVNMKCKREILCVNLKWKFYQQIK